MNCESTRFGTLELDDEHVLHFPHGLVGIPGQFWALVSTGEDSVILWLQSLEDADLALPVCRPQIVAPDYKIGTVPELQGIDADVGEPIEQLAVVTATDSLADWTINLVGPILISARTGKGVQAINERDGLSLRAPMWQHVEPSDLASASAVEYLDLRLVRVDEER